MPSMPRVKSKTTKVAFSILGTPVNMKDKKSSMQKRVDRRLLYDNTARVR